jgi:N-methylhydantoinase A/oxoprolinase/acetone carboxylase beta subunit
MHLGLGIDTGNTNTDSVLVDLTSGNVLKSAKALTTPADLLVGILASVDEVLDHVDPREISLVAVSTTLATNAVVEGRGSPIVLIMMGWEPKGAALPPCYAVSVDGAMDARGEERVELDEDALHKAIRCLPSETQAIAVSGYFSVRNPTHEQRVKEIARQETGMPVVCGHELAGQLGMYERTVTVALNARITPLVTRFLSDVHRGMDARDINAPMMVMRSDGSLVPEQYAASFPVQTVLSGPAASAVGGTGLSGLSIATIVDIGGTTTDIISVDHGLPMLDDAGATIGGWKTRVRGIKAWVTGLGGDSHVQLKIDSNSGFEICPQRVEPLAFANLGPDFADAAGGPKGIEWINRIAWPINGLSKSASILGELIPPTGIALNQLERLGREHGAYLIEQSLAELQDRGAVSRVGFTPTDALHVLGTYTAGSVKRAIQAAQILGNSLGLSAEQFAHCVAERFQSKLKDEILKKHVSDEIPGVDFLSNPLWNYMETRDHSQVRVRVSLLSPIVGLGAPVDAYLPQVAEALGCSYFHCAESGVGSAYGAITGKVVQRVDATLRKQSSDRFLVFLPDKRVVLEKTDDQKAMSYAYEAAKRIAQSRIQELGADNVRIEVRHNSYRLGIGKLSIMAIGDPEQSRQIATMSANQKKD